MFRRSKSWAGCVLLVSSFVASASGASVNGYSQLIDFGDSLSDTGNLAIATGGLYPGTNYDASGRFTDGPNTTPATTGPVGVWVDQLATKLGVPDPQPFLGGNGGTNYAIGGATTGSNGLYNITDQVNLFLAQNLTGISSTALYTIWGGANDLFNGGTSGATAANNLYGNIQTLASKGAKNFLWANLPPLDLTPRGAAIGGDLAAEVTSFNQTWASDLTKLQSAGINVVGVDVSGLFGQLLQNPGTYGFTNVTTPAQGLSSIDPNTYLFWDIQHPTTAGHAAVATLAYDDLTASAAPEPMSMAITALGFAALLAVARVRRSRQNADLRPRS